MGMMLMCPVVLGGIKVKNVALSLSLVCRLWSKVSSILLCSSKNFLNFRLSSARLLIKWFLIQKHVS